MVTLLLGEGLPDDKDEQALKLSSFWRVILGLPLILQIFSFFAMAFIIKYETPKFLIFN